MSKENLEISDIVRLTSEEWVGYVGIVSQPITEASAGHVLVYKAGNIIGVPALIDGVVPADKKTEGYALLAYNLIKLGSNVIEKGLL